jgi:hypothetical protein
LLNLLYIFPFPMDQFYTYHRRSVSAMSSQVNNIISWWTKEV